MTRQEDEKALAHDALLAMAGILTEGSEIASPRAHILGGAILGLMIADLEPESVGWFLTGLDLPDNVKELNATLIQTVLAGVSEIREHGMEVPNAD